MVLSLTTTTIFWPSGLQRSGFCYGWKSPLFCVAGVLNVVTKEEAISALDAACTAPAWRALQDSCGGRPEVLGYCEYDTQRVGVRMVSWKVQPILVFYHRHPLSSLRFYAFDASIFAPPLSASLHNEHSLAHAQLQTQDIGRPLRHNAQAGFNQITLNQFNASTLLQASIVDPSARMLPAIAAVLFSIGAITSLLAKPIYTLSTLVKAIAKIPATPTATVRDVCAIAQQIEVRAEQAEYFVAEIPHLRNRGESDITNYAVRYTQFFNMIWMILNDVTIGMAFGSFLTENAPKIAEFTNAAIYKYLVYDIIFNLRWLDSWPAGLKLNTELSRFYCHLFVGSIRLWERGLGQVTPFSGSIIYAIGVMGTSGGLSLLISSIMDVVAVVTLHVHACYFLTGLIYHRMLRTAGSLFNLFRGRRYNVLRNRVDSWEYDMDQLLFGTILFTLLAFLFPTVLVYYAMFAVARFTTLLLLATMEFLLTLVNHFPLFALMLSVKDPYRLPGGIYFRRKLSRTEQASVTHHNLVVENQVVPLSLLFSQYAELSRVLAKHYNPSRLVWCLLKGEYLGAIPRYEMRYVSREGAAP